ncbi:DUF5007 domain-containing protein [Joostella sp.]|uniref:DUF5007 domain-containing protein n=1 Tax=Joostella sp. TaxID=2231138 RepID=UPI003A8FEDD2
MKNIINYLILLGIAVVSCTPPEVGYISDNIQSSVDTLIAPKGLFTVGVIPISDGSTYPLHWEITGITDENGNLTDELNKEREILVWTSAFNGETDTTFAQVEEKLKLENHPPILINDVSGELAVTQASKFVDGDIFNISVNASNVKGSKQLDNFVSLKLTPFIPVQFEGLMVSRVELLRANGRSVNLFQDRIDGQSDDAVPSILDGSHQYFTITKVSDEPSLGVQTRMVITDSYDNPIDPSKVVFAPRGADFFQNYHDNSVDTKTDDEATIFSLPAPPFPQYSRTFGGDRSYQMYYITTPDTFVFDKEAYERDHEAIDWAPFTDSDTGEIRNRGYMRWAVKINDTGTWELRMRIPYTKKKE